MAGPSRSLRGRPAGPPARGGRRQQRRPRPRRSGRPHGGARPVRAERGRVLGPGPAPSARPCPGSRPRPAPPPPAGPGRVHFRPRRSLRAPQVCAAGSPLPSRPVPSEVPRGPPAGHRGERPRPLVRNMPRPRPAPSPGRWQGRARACPGRYLFPEAGCGRGAASGPPRAVRGRPGLSWGPRGGCARSGDTWASGGRGPGLDRGARPLVCRKLGSGGTREPGHKEVDSGRTRRPSWPPWPVLDGWKGAGGPPACQRSPSVAGRRGGDPSGGDGGQDRVATHWASLLTLQPSKADEKFQPRASLPSPGAVYPMALASLQLLCTQA